MKKKVKRKKKEKKIIITTSDNSYNPPKKIEPTKKDDTKLFKKTLIIMIIALLILSYSIGYNSGVDKAYKKVINPLCNLTNNLLGTNEDLVTLYNDATDDLNECRTNLDGNNFTHTYRGKLLDAKYDRLDCN